MRKSTRKSLNLDRFKSAAPAPVALASGDVVEMSPLRPGERLPLVIEPVNDDVDLIEWAQDHRELVEEKLLEHGALLFRGFGIDSVEIFERFAGTICSDLFNENGEHPRESVSGKVYTPVFYPPEEQLLWHNENSFNQRWPRKIFFACAEPPEEGGETPLVDSRAVASRLDPEIRRAFAEKGVMYVRNYGTGLGLDWRDVFRTDSRDDIDDRCREDRMRCEWRDGDRLRTEAVRPAVVEDPKTGETSWFSQAQHWHTACLSPSTRDSLRELYDEQDMPRTCRFGDGSEIPDEVMAEILDAYQELEVSFPWRRGDVVLVDNLLTAHGRNPFRGNRKILVAMGEMTSFRDLVEGDGDGDGNGSGSQG